MIGKILGEIFGQSELDTIVVAKGVCEPSRRPITALFKQYGVKLYGINESVEYAQLNGKDVPALFVAVVKVSKKQVVWAEYLLLRSKRFILMSEPKHPKNRVWAEKHRALPPSWNGRPVRELSCSD